MPDWLEIRIPVTPEIEEPVANFLFEQGCSGCIQRESELIAYFPQSTSAKALRQSVETYLNNLANFGFGVPEVQLQLTAFPDQDWNAEWKKHFKPLKVSDRFVIKPSWESYEKRTDELVIEIDPKQAFGTGTHETTQIMLAYLEKCMAKDHRVLDIGTGTGILAIGAGMLGARHVTAVDIDPVAVEAAQENIAANDWSSAVSLFVGELAALKSRTHFDTILANINKSIIFTLLDDLIQHLAPAGVLILSGILADELNESSRRFAQLAPTISVEHTVVGEWAGFLLKRNVEF